MDLSLVYADFLNAELNQLY